MNLGNLTKKQKETIINLFYRKDLRPGEKIIDNTDSSIAKEVNLPTAVVSLFISKHLNKKYKNFQPNE